MIVTVVVSFVTVVLAYIVDIAQFNVADAHNVGCVVVVVVLATVVLDGTLSGASFVRGDYDKRRSEC